MLNANDVQSLRDKGMTNRKILEMMAPVVPSAKKAIEQIDADTVTPEWQRESRIGEMLDKAVPKNAPSGLMLLTASGINEAEKTFKEKDSIVQEPIVKKVVPGATPFENAPGTAMERIKGAPKQIAEFGEAALPAIGSVVGGMAGLPGAIPTFGASVVGGAAAGRAIGEIGSQQIGSLLRDEASIGQSAGTALATGDSAQFTEQAKKLGKQALIGGAEGLADMVFMGAGKFLGKALKPFKSQVDDAAVRLFEKYGIKAPASALSKSETVRQGEAIAAKGVTGKPVQEVIEEATQKVASIGDDIVNKIGGTDDLMIAGKEILEGSKAYEQSWRASKNSLYQKADELINARASTLKGGEFINVDATKTALDNILSSKESARELLGEFVDVNKLETIRNNLDKKTSIKVLSSAIDEIHKMVPFGSKVDTGDIAALKSVAATMSKDLDNHIRLVQPDIGEALDAADEFYAEGITLLNSQVGNTIRRLADSPEKIAGAVIKNASPSDTKRLIQLISSTEDGAQRLDDVRSAVLRNMLESSKGDHGAIMGKTFFNQIKKMGSTIDELYTPEIAEGIREVAKMATALDKGQAAAKGSQTAFLTKIVAFFTALSSGNFQIAIPIAAQDVTFSKIFSTDWGRKLLTKGFEVAIPEGLKTAGRGVIRSVGERFNQDNQEQSPTETQKLYE